MTDSVAISEDDARLAPPRRSEDLRGLLFILSLGLFLLVLIYNRNVPWVRGSVFFADFLGTLIGACIGVMLGVAYYSPWRRLGFVPILLTLAFGLIAIWHTVAHWAWIGPAIGILGGMILMSLLAGFQFVERVRGELGFDSPRKQSSRRFTGEWMIVLGLLAMIACEAVIAVTLPPPSPPGIHDQWNIAVLIVLGLLLIAYSWLRLFRFTFELFIELLTRIGYRIASQGEQKIRLNGPVLMIANHACWWDPLFLAAIAPRPITPMMTASFHDIWFLKPIMKHAIGVIRVPEATARREAPEIRQAIAALDNGQCVMLFPEGYLRRKDDVPLRRFARGVYEILKARPETPVVACWIEGAWGSWCSWQGGPPAKGKRVDFRRKIVVGVAGPITVPASVLENHLATRVFLMNAVNAARPVAGVPLLPEFTVPTHDDDKESA